MRDRVDKYTRTKPSCSYTSANSEPLEPSRPPSSTSMQAAKEVVSNGAEDKRMHREIVPAPCCYTL